MNNFECTVTIADIYGAEWWERNREELEREWEWWFGIASGAESVASIFARGIIPIFTSGPYIILHRRKLKPPTLREVYGLDEVPIPVGWEWTGEWRVPVINDLYAPEGSTHPLKAMRGHTPSGHRLILRERPKKVWFKAEERHRASKPGDWAWVIDRWKLVGIDTLKPFTLCATRHEEVDQTVRVVTQEDIDKCGR